MIVEEIDLVGVASRYEVDFAGVPQEGKGLIGAIENCCRILRIDLDEILGKKAESFRTSDPEMARRKAIIFLLGSIAGTLLFVSYPDDNLEGDRIYLNEDNTEELRKTLRKITCWQQVMDALSELYPEDEHPIPVAEIIKSHARVG